ncbi:MAG: DUF3754 domain-containing protein [Planctomycetes bacterium]|nr:DUF3754 domain-containing protein [Planctomycetota bacterium]
MSRFLPGRVPHLIEELASQLPEEKRADFWALARVLEAFYHHAASAQTRTAETLYAPFDPDSETLPPARPTGEDPLGRLYDWLGALFERANFDLVTRDVLLTTTDRDVLASFEIDPDLAQIERLAVYTRGRGTKAVQLRKASKWFRLEEVEVPTYGRVAIVVRTKEEPHVLLRLFKDVPQADLELLLPSVRVKMKLLDRLKLSGSGGTAAFSIWKILKLAYAYTPTLAKLLTVPFKILLLPIGLIVATFYGGKTVLDYGRIKANYVTALAEHLYAITLASNRALLGRLSLMAGEEDTKEALIAYWLLIKHGDGLSPSGLRHLAEEWVWDRYRTRIRFDVEDALRKLAELELSLVETDVVGDRLRALPLPEALRQVDRAWDDLYSPPERPTRLWRLLSRQQRSTQATEAGS